MIYFDNGATTYPKPHIVNAFAYNAMKNFSFNSGRGGYKQSIKASEKIFEVREKICSMFGANSENVIFTKNCTEALNIAIKGCVQRGEHIVISSLEHNAVARVVSSLKERDIIDYDIAKYSFDREETILNFKKVVKNNTKAIVCMHSSNVFGVTFPISEIGKFCKERGILFIVDAAQGAGVGDINMSRDNIDILCAPGHKCLYGPMGTGFMILGENIKLSTLMEGGTGSSSLSLTQPDFTPDRYESGTLNNAGIIALGKGIDYVNSMGLANIHNHGIILSQHLYSLLDNTKGVTLYTPKPTLSTSMPIVSFNYKDFSSEKVASYLADNGICVRAGLHCSPLAHSHFETTESGTVRVSFGMFNKVRECEEFISVLKKM